jgi:hypothetical protein
MIGKYILMAIIFTGAAQPPSLRPQQITVVNTKESCEALRAVLVKTIGEIKVDNQHLQSIHFRLWCHPDYAFNTEPPRPYSTTPPETYP